ncbi:hypothetical protein NQ318_005908 [Aromia moschata]|uniref:Uncharacterized protein n=1 Tax=Aromia moschata TaxID=1265417 RepID=A0AAV8YS04_9CUCU|nr:hypothetical protein NQ318_005908 [Aromia moschata]
MLRTNQTPARAVTNLSSQYVAPNRTECAEHFPSCCSSTVTTPCAFVWWIGMHAVMFFFLFKEFYNQTHNRKRAAALAKAQNGAVQNGHVKNHLVQNGDVMSEMATSNGDVTKEADLNGHQKARQ